MATTNNTKTTPIAELRDVSQAIREQFMSTIQQGQQMSVDAAQTWIKAMSELPVAELPKVLGVPAVPGMEAATEYTFDVAADLLNAQRDFTLGLAKALAPTTSA